MTQSLAYSFNDKTDFILSNDKISAELAARIYHLIDTPVSEYPSLRCLSFDVQGTIHTLPGLRLKKKGKKLHINNKYSHVLADDKKTILRGVFARHRDREDIECITGINGLYKLLLLPTIEQLGQNHTSLAYALLPKKVSYGEHTMARTDVRTLSSQP